MSLLGQDFEALPQGEALRSYWLERLPEGERKILEIILSAYPQSVKGEAIDEATGYARSSRNTYLQRLKARGVIERIGRDEIRADETLFSG